MKGGAVEPIFIGLLVAFWAALPVVCSAASTAEENLFKAEIIVTGTGEKERERGFREGLREILTRLTGDPSLVTSEKLEPILNDAISFIATFTYEDRMRNLPIRDEQGTRERPHYLRLTADKAKIEAAMKAANLQIWERRPPIAVLLTVKDFKRSYIVTAETGVEQPATWLGLPLASSHYDGYEQREVLKSIASRRGLILELPQPSALARLSTPGSESAFGGTAARYRADLSVLASGYWKLEARGWGYSHTGVYMDAPSCFSFEVAEVSFDNALRKSVDAFAAWLRSDQNAPACGLSDRP